MKAKTKNKTDLGYFRALWGAGAAYMVPDDTWITVTAGKFYPEFLCCEYGGSWPSLGKYSPFCEFDEEIERELIIYKMR